jgi:spermidine synthase
MTKFDNRLILTALYCAIFIAPPVFLLGQTVPLISNFFPRQRHGKLAGTILFFSTLGSFVGATGSTLLLMATVGVHNATIVTIASIALLTALLCRKKLSPQVGIVAACLAVSVFLNSPMILRDNNIVTNNQYHTIQVANTSPTEKSMISDGNTSSSYDTQLGVATIPYIAIVDESFIDNMILDGGSKDILVIGAGGFTIGLKDTSNNYTFLDIDSSLQKTAEENFLGQKLSDNKKFVAMDARRFLNQSEKEYDLIVLDAYQGRYTVPETLVTREFFLQIKSALKDNGVLIANIIEDPAFADTFSVRLDRTFRSVFPVATRQVIGEYSGWKFQNPVRNVMYISYAASEKIQGIYTDDKNTSAFDRSH